MATVKLYNSEAWLKRHYVTLKETPAQMATAAGCSQITIYRKLKELGLIK